MSSLTPAYLNDLIQTAVPVRPLRSSDAPLLNVPRHASVFLGRGSAHLELTAIRR